MKHSVKIVIILLFMFLVAQILGLFIINIYSPHVVQSIQNNVTTNQTVYNLPYGIEPPADSAPKFNLISIIISFAIAILLIFILMKIRAEIFLRAWFFFVVTLALGIAINAFIIKLPYSSLIAIAIAIHLAIVKIYRRNILVHNITEVLIYPGIAAIFIPLLNLWTVILLLVLISVYDIYAVWHSGFMQKMAQYQIKKLRLFSGFFIPYMNPKDKAKLDKSKKGKKQKIKVNVAILGGGDVVFPIIFAGIVMQTMGIYSALLISLGATLALGLLFYYSEKGKFYPAMPFISAGCFVALILAHFIF